MRILLIDPPYKRFTGFVNFYYPIGLAYLGAVLRHAGHEVSIFDADAIQKGSDIDFNDEYRRLDLYRQGLNNNSHLAWQEIKTVIENFHPDLVGITAMTTKFGSVLKTAEVIKNSYPKLPVLVGGPHPTLLPEQALKSQNIDIVVRGEGERTVLNIAEAIENNESLEKMKGLSYKESGRVIHNPPQELIEDLDVIYFPARDLLMNPQNYTSEDMGVIMASRGCPFSCSYCCHHWGKMVRIRSVENVIDEIKLVKDKYGTRQFEFKDDTFTLNRKWVLEFCENLILKKIKINWGCTTRVDVLDEELIKAMKKAGCNIIKLGIETGSERILKETKKGVTFEQMKKVVKILNKHGLFWSGYFMIGLPTETEDDINKTYEFMKELNPYYAGLGVYNPFPKTELFEQGVSIGLLRSEVGLEHFFDTNPKDYFFVSNTKRVASIEKDRFDIVVKLMMDRFHKHNTRIRNIIRRGWARRFVYLQDPGLLLSDIKKVINWLL
ncbi:radical SAM protein [bacterium]|nr:MAG: radical SAM protein [bacterium]